MLGRHGYTEQELFYLYGFDMRLLMGMAMIKLLGTQKSAFLLN
jgi:hypothetical protein